MFIIFQALDLPKEEDFYQFQFLRTDEKGEESAIGASVPFQLQTPKSEELCTVEDEEFMVVRYVFKSHYLFQLLCLPGRGS